jgi:hypothetical protein
METSRTFAANRCPAAGDPSRLSLAVPGGRRVRLRRALERAEMTFAARIAEDGGIVPWRRLIEVRFLAARETFARRDRLSRTDTAALVLALTDEPTRDRCWVQVEANRDPAWIGFWLYLARRSLPPYRAEPLFLLAWTAFRLRDAELARAAVDDTLIEEPRHTAASMLQQLVQSDTDPSLLPSLSDRYASRQSGP